MANGTRIKNIGELKLYVWTEHNQRRLMTCQVCDVHKCFLSTSKLNDAGQRVMLDGPNSYIEDKKTLERVPLLYKDRVYYMKVWVRRAQTQQQTNGSSNGPATGFARQG